MLTPTLIKYGLIFAAILSLVGYLYYKGVSDEKENQKVLVQKEFINTTKRINNAPTSSTRDDALERLRLWGDVR